jgi:intermediate peptidase
MLQRHVPPSLRRTWRGACAAPAPRSTRVARRPGRCRRAFWHAGSPTPAPEPAPRCAPAGLVAIDGLHTPDDFLRLATTSVESCESLLGAIVLVPPSAHVLHLMDEMSEQLCRVMDAAELCRNVHPDAAWRSSSNAVYAHLASFIQRLNSTPELHAKLAAILAEDAVASTLCPEERIVATQLQEDMERNGVHLPAAQRQRYATLQAELLQLSSEFMENAASANTLNLSAEQMAVLPRAVQNLFTAMPGGAGHVVCDRAMSGRLLKWVADGAIRREIYVVANSCATDNLGVLHRILQCRHEMAVMLGADSYGEYVAKGMMAGSTATIDAFLNDLLDSTRPKAREELRRLAEAKARAEDCELSDDGVAAVLHPWDTHYYMGLTKAAVHQIDGSDLSAYFSLENCLDGLNLAVSRLFDMTLQRVECSPEEV